MEEQIEEQNMVESDDDETSGRSNWNKNTILLAAVILIAALLIGGSLVYSKIISGSDTLSEKDLLKIRQDVDNDPMLGDKKARVTIIEFSDYQCLYCRAFWKDTFPSIKKDYIDTGKVRFVFRDFPLTIHPAAEISAEAANCANDQGKYWEMQDKIFGEQAKQGAGTIAYTEDDLKKWGGEISLDTNKFNSCLDSGKYKSEIQKDLEAGTKAGVEGTPMFYVNGKELMGAQPYDVFKTAIEEVLK